MSRPAMRLLLPALGLLLALGVVFSCAKKADQASKSTPPASGPVTVVAVDLGRSIGSDKQVTESVETFKPNDTIYASIHTNGASPSAKLGVKWTFQDGQVVDQSEQMIAPDGVAATEFHITKPDGFPAGDYKLEVSLDGSPVQTRDFKVTAS
jgi:hypothetical protein